MKNYILILLLLPAAGFAQTLAQVMNVPDSLVIYEREVSDESSAILKYGDTIVIEGDTIEVVKMMFKTIEEKEKHSEYLRGKLSELRDALDKSTYFANSVPDFFKKGKNWNKYLAALRKQNYNYNSKKRRK